MRESYYASRDGFVGLAHFVKNHLGLQGYDFKSSYELASHLDAKGVVQIYQVENPDGEFPTAAIRTVTQAGEISKAKK